jgi:YebC/PmpR family DNA-binding regulatory protein
MAGHSHSANIRFRKDRQDAARGKVFSKLAREIMSAAREGGGDPASNLRLRYVIDRAKSMSMPRDNIERAIKKGTGELQGESLEELLYEGYGPGGVAILIESLTDNRNRTAPELRRLFEKRGGNLGSNGAVAWMFDRKGVFVVPREGGPTEDEMMELVIELDGDDLIVEDEAYEVRSEPGDFHRIGKLLQEKGVGIGEARIGWIPNNTVQVAERDKAQQVLTLIADLEEHDDVQAVAANYDIPDELMAQLDA